MALKISFVIPVRNEEASVSILYKDLKLYAKKFKPYEIIFVDDGSDDNTFKNLKKLSRKDNTLKLIKLRGRFGKSAALQTGFDISRGKIIITLDGDLQDNPKEISKFIEKINEGYDLVSGWKKKRHDPLTRVVPSRILNYLMPYITGVKLHDVNCGFKAYRREVIENLNLYGELYRFIPIIAAKKNFKVTEIIVEHRKRLYGKTKFGWDRNIKGLLDLITIIFLTGYITRPGHFFGTLGLVSFILGFMIGLYITYLRLSTGTIQYRQPLLFLGILLIIIGIQLISTGLLAEMMIFSNPKQKEDYKIKEILE